MDFQTAASWSASELFSRLDTRDSGLTEVQVRERIKQSGPNELAQNGVSPFRIWLRQFRSAFIYLLLAAAAVSFSFGDLTEAGIILAFVFLNSTIGFLQEYHSERAMELLKRFAAPRARVKRSGNIISIDAKDAVVGDVLIIAAGDRVPADVRLLESSDLEADESALTGESASARKSAAEKIANASDDIHQAVNIVFAETNVVRGEGVGIIFATGSATTFGNIASLSASAVRISAFEKNLGKFSAFLMKTVLVTVAGIFAANLAIRGAHINVVELLIFSIALAVSIIPEALPLVTLISHSRGALRLAKQKAVVKRLSAIEDLGSIEVLCTDKTGTVTENRMTVEESHPFNGRDPLAIAALAADSDSSFDAAIRRASSSLVSSHRIIQTVPFDPDRRRASALVLREHECLLIVRGAPESVLPLCPSLSESEKNAALAWAAEQGTQGRRVLAIASKSLPCQTKKYRATEESGLRADGLLAFEDPLKPTAAAAVAHAKRLGVAVKILTGDGPEVAAAIATQVGILQKGETALTGADLETMDEKTRRKTIMRGSVFARLSPKQKFDIIRLLQETREVGFLGEGINDAPALRAANVGLVVQGASDIARDAADVILLDKSLDVIINSIRSGREVFANTVKYIKTTLAPNFGNFFTLAVASLVMDDLPMLPMQLLLVGLLSDTPMIAISTDAVDAQELRRPRHYEMKSIIITCLVLGAVSSPFDFLMLGAWRPLGLARLRTNWFIGSVLTELVFIFSIRARGWAWKSRAPSRPIAIICAAAAVTTVAIPFTSFGQTIFGFLRPEPSHLLAIAAILVAYFLTTETTKVALARTKAT